MAEAKAWRVVLSYVERQLRSGDLGPGDRLPGERDLATQLGVGRSSVREALRVLEVMGVLHTATGSGPRAGAV
ncbi:MAG TPA: GntR family transcriptional regulator, partial [Microbacterium sp.]|nr:GntR family transcriptional regulator [Microbacterium sp.]